MRKRSLGRAAEALAPSEPAEPPREAPLCGSSAADRARFGTGRSMIGCGAGARR
jgi:hypothetical protein